METEQFRANQSRAAQVVYYSAVQYDIHPWLYIYTSEPHTLFAELVWPASQLAETTPQWVGQTIYIIHVPVEPL